jgi:NAD(P)-dependent dehydrogenase (short-subunit alcohol dehydrogenase family)
MVTHEKNHDDHHAPPAHQTPKPTPVNLTLTPLETCEALVESAVARHTQRVDILFLKVSFLRI